METRVETLAELKKIRFGQYGTIFCKETEREYYFEPNGGSLTPDDLDVVLPVQGGNARLVAHKAFSSGGGGGSESFLSLSDTPGTYSGQAGKLVAVNGAANALEFVTAPGGSAYPDNVTIVSGGGTHDLTLSEQGVVIVTDTTTVRLPASPPAGTTYKITATAGLVNIDTNGSLIAGYGSGVFRAGRVPFIVKALYLPSLIWGVENKNTYHSWYADAAYGVGDRVQVAGVVYESRNDNNIGNDPIAERTWWRLLVEELRANDSYAAGDFSFIGGTPPLGVSGQWQVSQVGSIVSVHVHFSATSAGSGITRVEIPDIGGLAIYVPSAFPGSTSPAIPGMFYSNALSTPVSAQLDIAGLAIRSDNFLAASVVNGRFMFVYSA